MALSDLKGEDAVRALADMLEPAMEIAQDQEFVAAVRGGDKVKAVTLALKRHSKEVVAILAAMDGVKPEDYEVNLLTIPKKLLEIGNDPEVINLFRSQGQMTELKSSGSATENTEDGEK